MKRTLAAVVATAPLICAHAQSIDTSFGSGGEFILEMAGASSYFLGSVRQNDGKIVMVGSNAGLDPYVNVADGGRVYAYLPANALRDIVVARTNPTGQLDPSFGTNGIVTIDFNGLDDRGSTVVQQPDGKIVVSGATETSPGNFDAAFVRLNTNGTFDTTFNGTGKLTVSLGNTDDDAPGLAVQQDGRIIGAGSTLSLGTATSAPGVSQVAVVRLLPDGTLDASFGTNGIALPTAAGVYGSVRSLQLQSDGNLLLAGQFHPDGVAMRLTSAGALDTGFGAAGIAQATTGGVQPLSILGLSLATDAGHGIAIAGVGPTLTIDPTLRVTFNSAIAQLNPGGSANLAFGAAGVLTQPLQGPYDAATSVTFEPGGKLLVAGQRSRSMISPAGPADSYIARILPNGSLDTTFGTNGVMTVSFDPVGALSGAIATMIRKPDGKLLLVGYRGATGANNGSFTDDILPASQRGMAIQLHSTPVFGFAVSTASVREDQTSIELSVSRMGSTTGPVSIRYGTSSGTASSGGDFVAADSTLTWMPDDADTKTVTLSITADSAYEAVEQFVVALSEPTEGSIGNSATTTVSITDDDPAPQSQRPGGGSMEYTALLVLLSFAVVRNTKAFAMTRGSGRNFR